MSKNFQNKEYQNKEYYEIGIWRGGNLIKEYTTALPIIYEGNIIHKEIINYLKSIHGNDIIVLLNEKIGKIPNDNRGEIKIHIPEKSEFKYNK